MKKITFPTFDTRRAAILAGFLVILFVVSLYAPTLQPLDAGYTVTRSLRFNDDDSASLSRTFPGAGNRKTWTYSLWFKKGSVYSGNNYAPVFAVGTSALGVGGPSAAPNSFYFNQSGVYSAYTTATFRDSSAWYHVVYVYDTTQATAADRIKIYVNGERMAITTEGGSPPTQNSDGPWNAASAHNIGFYSPYYLDGYLADVHFIDGLALDPSYFGETNTTTGSWVAKRYTGSYGTNGFKLNFADNSGVTATTLGKDVSGNGNNWTPNNFSVTAGAGNDSLTDVPTMSSTASNWVVFTPVDVDNSTDITIRNGGLEVVNNNTNNSGARASIGMSSGKWYAEMTASTNRPVFGLYRTSDPVTTYPGGVKGWSYNPSGNKTFDGSSSGYGSSWLTGSVISIAVDMDAGKVWWAVNGVWQASGDPVAGTNAAFSNLAGETVSFGIGDSGETAVGTFNGGQRPFAYTPPTGFKALNAYNLPEPSITKPNQYFDAKTYTGNGTVQSVTGLNFQPDFTWIKDRTSANAHRLFDAFRRDYNYLSSNSTGTEVAGASSTLTAFTSDGFVLGTNSLFNTNSNNYISWNWDEGSVPGFDVVEYEGTGVARNINHSLGATPAFILIKDRVDGSRNWHVWHKSFSSATANYLYLNTTAAIGSSAGLWNTGHNSSTFGVSADAGVNQNKNSHIAYLWSEVPGFSKFGSYTGNGSADGPFVYTGFKPAYILVKRTDTTANWENVDSARDTYNPANHHLYPNVADAESVTDNYDLLSNGFKLRSTGVGRNASGGTYIYAAFAEYPFKYANGDDASTITKSLRFSSGDSANLSRTPGSVGNRQIWTWSGWIKKTTTGTARALFTGGATASDAGFSGIWFSASDQLTVGGYNTNWRVSSAVFRDPSTWMHVVVSFDATQATANNRIRVFIDGSEVTSFGTLNNPTQNTDYGVNQAALHEVGYQSVSAGISYFDGYMADVHFVDGQALTPSSFGQTDTATGRWEPKAYVGTYGANGFHLNFTDTSSTSKFALGNDSAGYTGIRYSIAGVGTAQLSTVQSKFGGASATMGGSTGRIPVTDTNLALGTGDFTVEGWFYFNSVSGNPMLFDFRPSSTQGAYPGIYLNSGALNFYANNANAIVGSTVLSTGQWYHVAVSRSGNSTRLFLNGVQEGSTYSDSTNYLLGGNAAIGNGGHTSTLYLDGYIDDFRIYSGVAKYTGTFTPPNAALPIGTSDTNWKYVVAALPMDGANAATSFPVYTGGNHWTPNNFSVTAGVGNDSLNDVPSLGSGASNTVTFSPLTKHASATHTLSDGNLYYFNSSVSTAYSAFGTIAMTSPSYFEYTLTATPDSGYPQVGFARIDTPYANLGQTPGGSSTIGGMGYNTQTGAISIEGSSVGTYSTAANGDVIQIAYNPSNGKVWVGKNGAWFNSGDPAAGTGNVGTITSNLLSQTPAVISYKSVGVYLNGGQRAFVHSAPTGFAGVTAYNQVTPAITKPNQYFEAKTYTGNATTRTISGLNFQPELVWLKDRTSANAHGLFDVYRRDYGYLASNATDAETASGSTTLTAFLSNGFVLGGNSTVNTNTNNYISWNWKKGVIPGFDIASYVGTGSAQTLNHNLGAVPKFMIMKSRVSNNWAVYHQSLGNTQGVNLNATNGASVSSGWWNNTSPSSSSFTVGTGDSNVSGSSMIAYLWSEVAGFSKFGSYTGNGSTDGPFVYTGFKPRYLLIKKIDSTTANTGWAIFDTARDTYNPVRQQITAESTSSEGASTNGIDFLANGFKVRAVDTVFNNSGSTFIYAAFAEYPFKYSTAGFGSGGGGGIIPFLLTDPF